MKKVTAIGGIFFKCKDPEQVNDWYKTHLGVETSPYGAKFDWREADSDKKDIPYGALLKNLPNILNLQKKIL